MRQWLLVAMMLALPAAAQQAELDKVTIRVAELTLSVELANEHSERVMGLMKRKSALPGMLFYYPEPRRMALWMRDTYIPLDAAYINKDGVIVDIIQLKPLDETSRPAPGKIIAALEMPQGWFAKHNIQVGDKVSIPEDVKAFY